jgi:hypothetical protein
VATEDLTRVLDEAGVRHELLPHARTESALAEAEALGVASATPRTTSVPATKATLSIAPTDATTRQADYAGLGWPRTQREVVSFLPGHRTEDNAGLQVAGREV